MNNDIVLVSDYNNIIKINSNNTVIINESNNIVKIVDVAENIVVENNKVRIVSIGIQGPPGASSNIDNYIPFTFTYGTGIDSDKLFRIDYVDTSYKLIFYSGSSVSRIDFYRQGINNIYRQDYIYNIDSQLIRIDKEEVPL